jgi:hypothetical protein
MIIGTAAAAGAGGAALHDRLVEEALRRRHRGKRADLGPAAGLTHDRHVARVAAEVRDVVADPFEGEHDVEHPDVAGCRELLPAHAREVAVAERAQAMVDRAEDGIAEAGEVLAAVTVVLDAVAVGEAAAVDPEQHRPLLAVLDRGREDVELQAVFADVVVVPVIAEGGVRVGVAAVHVLGRGVAPPDGRTHVRPDLGLLRRHEPVGSRGVGAVGNPHSRCGESIHAVGPPARSRS